MRQHLWLKPPSWENFGEYKEVKRQRNFLIHIAKNHSAKINTRQKIQLNYSDVAINLKDETSDQHKSNKHQQTK